MPFSGQYLCSNQCENHDTTPLNASGSCTVPYCIASVGLKPWTLVPPGATPTTDFKYDGWLFRARSTLEPVMRLIPIGQRAVSHSGFFAARSAVS